MRKILLAGCGSLGMGLANLLLKENKTSYEFWGLKRNTSSLPAFIHPWKADLTDSSTLSNPPTHWDDIIYTATPSSYTPQSYEQIYSHGLHHLLQALSKQAPSHFLLVSSTSVYHQNNGETVTEESFCEPTAFSGQMILSGEQKVKESGLPWNIVRFAGIYGDNRRTLLDRVLQGKMKLSSDNNLYTNRIHEQDCIHILAYLLQNKPQNEIWNGVDSLPVLRNDFLQGLSELTKTPIEYEENYANSRSKRTPSHKRCCNRKLLHAGYSFLYPTFVEGYSSILSKKEKQ